MNKLKTIFRLLLFTTIISSTANAQYLPDLTMDKDFKSQVKSIDEFTSVLMELNHIRM